MYTVKKAAECVNINKDFGIKINYFNNTGNLTDNSAACTIFTSRTAHEMFN